MNRQYWHIVCLTLFLALAPWLLSLPGFEGLDITQPNGASNTVADWPGFERGTRESFVDAWNKYLVEHNSNGTHKSFTMTGAHLTPSAITSAGLSTTAYAAAKFAYGTFHTNDLAASLRSPAVLLAFTNDATAITTNTIAETTLYSAVIPSNTYRYILVEASLRFQQAGAASAVEYTPRFKRFGTELASYSWLLHATDNQIETGTFSHLAAGGHPSNVTYSVTCQMDTANANKQFRGETFILWGIP